MKFLSRTKITGIVFLMVGVYSLAAFGAQAYYDEYDSDYSGYYFYEEPQSYEQGYYESSYQGGYGGSEQGSYQADYGDQGGSESYYQSYYEGNYQPASQEPPTTEQIADYQCNRRGHNDDTYCPGETIVIPDSSSISYELNGERFGGSRVWGEICVTSLGGGEPECRGFYGSGSMLGAERSNPGTLNTYTNGTLSCSGGCIVTFWTYVQDANSKWNVNVMRQGALLPSSESHSYCSNSSCVSEAGPGTMDCSGDAECLPGVPPESHYECVGCWTCGRVAGAGGNSCSSGADCGCRGPVEGTSQSGYEGEYQGSYESGYEARYQSGYYSQGYYYAQGTYSHAGCLGNGSCGIVSGGGADECTSANELTVCPQPPPSCISFSASPDRFVIPPPGIATLSWSCTGATNCSISPGVGSVAPNGSTNVSANQDRTYTLTCFGKGNLSSVSTNVSVTVRVFEFIGGKLKEIVP